MEKSSGIPARSPGVVTSLRLSREQHDALKAVAARENRSVSGQLRHIIERLAAEEQEREAA